MKKFMLLLAIASLTRVANAQKNFRKDADREYESSEFFAASELYKTAFIKTKKKPEKAEMIFRIAECYRMMNEYKQEELWYDRAVQVRYPNPIIYLHLANSKKSQGKFLEAITLFTDYQKEVPADPRGESGIKSCELAVKWKNNPTRYVVNNLAMINSGKQDFSPAYADKKHSILYFTSTREGSSEKGEKKGDKMTGQVFSDIFETKVDKNGKWSTPVPIADPVNEKFHEGSCVVNKKGTLMFFTRCEMQKNEQKQCQLYMTIKKSTVWEEPQKFPFDVDSLAFGYPALSADDQTLIFASDMPGGYGMMDLWTSTFDKKTKVWTKPVNLGPKINTAGYEGFPFISDDGNLFFSSDGYLGMGGLDIFKADVSSETQWSNVTNMQYPINSPSDDFGIIFDGKRNRGYLSSNREGGKGSDDIYSFYMPPCTFVIEGTTTNCEVAGEPIAGVVMKLVGTDGSTVEMKTDSAGHYKFANNGDKRYVNENTSYVISTFLPSGGREIKTASAKWGFINNVIKAKETTFGVCEKIFVHNFCLLPLPPPSIGDIHFGDVLYEYDKATLTQQSKDTLDVLYTILIENPGFVIELSAHTDARGSEVYNKTLSEARAQSCVSYLISKGINGNRLAAKGYGKKQPLKIIDKTTGQVKLILDKKYIESLPTIEEQDAAHQMNRRTVFSVIRKDFIDPNASIEVPKQVQPKDTDDENGGDI